MTYAGSSGSSGRVRSASVGRCPGTPSGAAASRSATVGVEGEGGGGVAQHQGDPLLRVGRVDGQERGARLRHRQLGEDHVRKEQQQRDDGAGPGAPCDEPVRQPVGAVLGLREGERPTAGGERVECFDRGGGRPPVDGGLDERGQGGGGHRAGRGAGRAEQQPVALRGRQDVEVVQAGGAVRGGQDVQGVQQLSGQRCGAGRVEVPRVVAEFDGQPVAGRDDHGERVVGGLPGVQVSQSEPLRARGRVADGVVLEDHQAVEERGARRQFTEGLQRGEGQVVVAPVLGAGLLEGAQPDAAFGAAVDLGAGGQGGDEQAGDGVGAGQIGGPSGDGGAEDRPPVPRSTGRAAAPRRPCTRVLRVRRCLRANSWSRPVRSASSRWDSQVPERAVASGAGRLSYGSGVGPRRPARAVRQCSSAWRVSRAASQAA